MPISPLYVGRTGQITCHFGFRGPQMERNCEVRALSSNLDCKILDLSSWNLDEIMDLSLCYNGMRLWGPQESKCLLHIKQYKFWRARRWTMAHRILKEPPKFSNLYLWDREYEEIAHTWLCNNASKRNFAVVTKVTDQLCQAEYHALVTNFRGADYHVPITSLRGRLPLHRA